MINNGSRDTDLALLCPDLPRVTPSISQAALIRWVQGLGWQKLLESPAPSRLNLVYLP